MDTGQMYITEPGIMGNPAVMEKIKDMREFMIANPDIVDITDYSEKYKDKDDSEEVDFKGIEAALEGVDEDEKSEFLKKLIKFRNSLLDVPEMAKGGLMNAKRGLVDEPGGYAGEMPSIKEIWSKEGEDDPLGTIVKLGLTFRKPIVEIVNAIGVTASVAADLISGVAKLGYDVTEPIRDVVGDVAGGIYDVGKEMVKGSKDNTRFIQPLYYLQRFVGS